MEETHGIADFNRNVIVPRTDIANATMLVVTGPRHLPAYKTGFLKVDDTGQRGRFRDRQAHHRR